MYPGCRGIVEVAKWSVPMRRVMVLCGLAALAAGAMLALNATSASAFGCGYSTHRAYGYTAYRMYRPYYRSRVYGARYYRLGVRRGW